MEAERPPASTIIAFAHASPRDPGGVNPMGIESMMGADPYGEVLDPPTTMAAHNDHHHQTMEDDNHGSNNDYNNNNNNNNNASSPSAAIGGAAAPTTSMMIMPQEMAMLVGIPPPPPSTPPPPRRRRSKSTPRTSNGKNRDDTNNDNTIMQSSSSSPQAAHDPPLPPPPPLPPLSDNSNTAPYAEEPADMMIGSSGGGVGVVEDSGFTERAVYSPPAADDDAAFAVVDVTLQNNSDSNEEENQRHQYSNNDYDSNINNNNQTRDPPTGENHVGRPAANQATPRQPTGQENEFPIGKHLHSVSTSPSGLSQTGATQLPQPQSSPFSIATTATEPTSNHHPQINRLNNSNNNAPLSNRSSNSPAPKAPVLDFKVPGRGGGGAVGGEKLGTGKMMMPQQPTNKPQQPLPNPSKGGPESKYPTKNHRFRPKTPDRFRPKTPERLRRMLAYHSTGELPTGKKGNNNIMNKQQSSGSSKSVGSSNKKSPGNPNHRRARTMTADQARRRTKTPDRRRPQGSKGPNQPAKQSGGAAPVASRQHSIKGKLNATKSTDSSTLGKGESVNSTHKALKRGFFRKLFTGPGKKKGKDEYQPLRRAAEGNDDAATLDTDHGKSTINPVPAAPDAVEVVTVKSREMAQPSNLSDKDGMTLSAYPSSSVEGPPSVSDERASVFFAHDEVSTLTAPTMEPYDGRDPREENDRVSEPGGRYWNHNTVTSAGTGEKEGFHPIDPFTEPFFQEPDGASPMPKKGSAVQESLRIHVPPMNDPVGESPLNSLKKRPPSTAKHSVNDPSPQGYQTGPASNKNLIQDPIGESPLHKHQRGPTALLDGTPYAPDPPLYLSDFEEDSKEGGEQTPASTASAQRLIPPPPASPSPRVRSIKAHRQVRDSPQRPPPSESPPRTYDNSTKQTILSAARGSTYFSSTPTSVSSDRSSTSFSSGQNTSSTSSEYSLSSSPGTNRSSASSSLSPRRTTSPTSTVNEESRVPQSPKDNKPKAKEVKTDNEVKPNDRATQNTEAESPNTRTAKQVVKARMKAKHEAMSKVKNQHVGESPKQAKKATESSPVNATPKSPQSTKKDKNSNKQAKKKPKHLTMSSAAKINAKAVAYLRTLNGEPSPRHDWRQPGLSDDDASPVTRQSSGQFRLHSDAPVGLSLHIPIVTTEPRQHATKEQQRRTQLKSNPSDPPPPTAVDSDAVILEDAASKLFSAYSGKFKGRKPKAASAPSRPTTEIYSPPDVKAIVIKTKGTATQEVPIWKKGDPLGRDVSISDEAVSFGFALLREKREDDIANGRAERVIPVRKIKLSNVQSYFNPYEREPKDPIQRAGRRLLSKAAIPVQAAARRYLAQREAVDRMWALLEIQSYLRRWRAETAFIASVVSVIKIQKVFRAAICRGRYHHKQRAAKNIQRTVRGYISAIRVYEYVYCVILIQARARGNQVQSDMKTLKENATIIQSTFRASQVRRMKEKQISGVCKIQALWRSYLIRTCYQYVVVDIIITQSAVRRWFACRHTRDLRNKIRNNSATKIQKAWRAAMERDNYKKFLAVRSIQAVWRGSHAVSCYQRYKAATKIQAMWRSFQAYTDYIFALVDLLVVQRTIRRFLAMKKLESLRKEKAAVMIQKHWRRRGAQLHFLYDLVHIIMVQSLVRSYFARNVTAVHRQEHSDREVAATKIQAAWRGFWGFSHFIIMRYEATRLQAAIRGKIAQKDYIMQLGCCIMIQTEVRRFLARKKAFYLRMEKSVTHCQVEALRECNASKRIQLFWRVALECRKEKQAALVIERFFLMVKREVDLEILRAQEKKHSKRVRQRKKKEGEDEKLLEHVWLDTVDDDHVDVFSFSRSRSSGSGSAARAQTPTQQSLTVSTYDSLVSTYDSLADLKVDSITEDTRNGGVRHRASSPTMNLVMRHEYDERKSIPPLPANSSSFSKNSSGRKKKKKKKSRVRMEALSKGQKKPGFKTAPNRSSHLDHFFENETDSTNPKGTDTRRKSLPASCRYDRSAVMDKRNELTSPAANTSPRHATILLMNPHPGFSKAVTGEEKETIDNNDIDDSQYMGEEFGMI